MKKVAFFAILIAEILCATVLSAQQLSWKHYTVNDGLLQSQVGKIFQDSRGFLWVSTRLGVSRFDGIHFENFTEKDGLFSSWADEIVEDAENNIWISHGNGLSCYDGQSFKSYPFPSWMRESHARTMMPYHADSVKIYRLTLSNVFSEILLQKGSFALKKQIQLPVPDKYKIDESHIKVNHVTKKVWLNDGEGNLYSYDDGALKKISTSRHEGYAIGHDGRLYLVDDGNLCRLENDQPQVLVHDVLGYDFYGWLKMAVDKAGNVVLIDQQRKHGKIFSAHSGTLTAVNFPQADDIFFDREDNLWLATETGFYRTNSLAVVNYLPEKGGLNANIWSITEGKHGVMYFSSYFDGLQQYTNGRFEPVKNLPKQPNGKPVFLAMGSIVDEENNLYLTTAQYSMLKYDGQVFTVMPKINQPISTFIIRKNRNDGSLLIGGNNYFLRVKNETTFDSMRVLPGNGKSGVVTGIEADKHNRIWLGGFNGMSLLQNDSLIHFPTKEFPFEYGGNTLLRDHFDNLWIGNKNGLFFYNYHNFQKIESPLLNDLILSLITVGDSMLYIGSINKIYRLNLRRFYNHQPLEIISIGADKGFEGIEPGQNGFFKDSKNYLWLPCNDRCVRIDPALIRENKEPPQVYMNGLHLLDNRMAWKKVEDSNQDSFNFYAKKDEKNFKFDFVGICLGNPQGVSYSHLLEGYDKNWSEPSFERYAIYTNLPPGDYQFKVKAANADGVWSTTEAVQKFSIVPTIYQRLWFQISMTVLLGGFLFATGAYFMDLHRKKQRQLLENDYKMSELRLLAIQNQIEPHFTYNALNTIAAAVLKEEKNIAYSYFVKLSQLMRAVLQTHNQLITSLEDELTFVNNYLQIQQLRFANKFDYVIEITDDVHKQCIIPKMCIQTFAENAIKHGLLPKAGKGQLNIRIFNEEDFLCIHVEDDGIGHEKARLLKTNGSTNGLKIMKGYFEHFNLLNSKKLEWKIIDLFSADNQPAGTGVYVKIPHGFIYSKN
ncbi:MAG: histidine kinase [Bacteroidales bacterium]|nr:histidine kinase [Bacteroidales bacterium]